MQLHVSRVMLGITLQILNRRDAHFVRSENGKVKVKALNAFIVRLVKREMHQQAILMRAAFVQNASQANTLRN